LSLKQDKRLLIVANRSLQEENNKWIRLAESNYETISSLQSEINNHKMEITNLGERLQLLDSKFQDSNKLNKELSQKLKAEKNKLRMIGFELEKSLEDELDVKRKYSELEREANQLRELLRGKEQQAGELQSAVAKQGKEAEKAGDFLKTVRQALAELDSAAIFTPGRSRRKQEEGVGVEAAIEQLLQSLRRKVSRLARKLSASQAQLSELLAVLRSYDDLLLTYTSQQDGRG